MREFDSRLSAPCQKNTSHVLVNCWCAKRWRNRDSVTAQCLRIRITALTIPVTAQKIPGHNSRHNPGHGGAHNAGMAALTMGALGVVFGDIGTSPLYALRETFEGHDLDVNTATVYGACSLVSGRWSS